MIRRLAMLAALAAIAAAGVVAFRRAEQLANLATPQGAAKAAGSLIDAARGFVDDVKDAAAKREVELRETLLAGESNPNQEDV
ncbi:MAG: hypothetical protein LBH48_00690 [Bifidobacteriaceae bacterium]|jgi:hypothetical protein|nr:hypothetical protein [Bifidobacteriaceae bacterium]